MQQRGRLDHRRTHNTLLINRLLKLHDNASPFMLILDSLAQSSRPLVENIIGKAKGLNCFVILLSSETLDEPEGVDYMLRPGTRPLTELREEIESLLSRSKTRTLFLIDSLNALATIATSQMSTFLSSLITPTVTLVGTYHEDVPVMDALSAYSPHPLTLLRYIATTVFTVHSLAHVLARKAAKDRSSALPLFGLDEDEEGLVIGFGSNDPRGVVLEMEHRRKSGRTIKEWFFVSARSEAPNPRAPGFGKEDRVILLEDHPLYKASLPPEIPGMDQKVDVGSSFDLGLTEKQRKDRDGVVLPYYDAQRDVGSAGGGGRILYDMGEEDDFDEEEDEI